MTVHSSKAILTTLCLNQCGVLCIEKAEISRLSKYAPLHYVTNILDLKRSLKARLHWQFLLRFEIAAKIVNFTSLYTWH